MTDYFDPQQVRRRATWRSVRFGLLALHGALSIVLIAAGNIGGIAVGLTFAAHVIWLYRYERYLRTVDLEMQNARAIRWMESETRKRQLSEAYLADVGELVPEEDTVSFYN